MRTEAVKAERLRERMPASPDRVAYTRDTARALRRRATPSEIALWAELRSGPFRPFRFRRQHPIGPYIVDFFSSRAGLIVEVDGPIHEAQQKYDTERQAELEGAGYRVIRVTAVRVMTDMPAVLRVIGTAARADPPRTLEI